MKSDDRLTGARPADLDLPPPDPSNTETEDFRDGFLRGPATGQMEHVAAAVHLLPLRVYAVEKAPRMLLEHMTDPRRPDDVHADLTGIAHAEGTRNAPT